MVLISDFSKGFRYSSQKVYPTFHGIIYKKINNLYISKNNYKIIIIFYIFIIKIIVMEDEDKNNDDIEKDTNEK